MIKRLVPLEAFLADPVLVAVADAHVRTEYVSSDPPVWASLAERMADVVQNSGPREAELQAWRPVQDARRFIEMYEALVVAKLKQQQIAQATPEQQQEEDLG